MPKFSAMAFPGVALFLLLVTIIHFSINITAGVKFFTRTLPSTDSAMERLQEHFDKVNEQCEEYKRKGSTKDSKEEKAKDDKLYRIICEQGIVADAEKKGKEMIERVLKNVEEDGTWKTIQKICRIGRTT